MAASQRADLAHERAFRVGRLTEELELERCWREAGVLPDYRRA